MILTSGSIDAAGATIGAAAAKEARARVRRVALGKNMLRER